ncbi:MAG: hypothetical protein N2Z23_10360 [Pyrinomonadaceae bacterium]|nr:hypothetical protein [Pyrinomonadaceae bacterium]MCX7640827.1 hypothetical protein [Pyrinomonadaceae bacterium]MDW8303408.1 hypothetical protein [Acidobacteriota bacterium]
MPDNFLARTDVSRYYPYYQLDGQPSAKTSSGGLRKRWIPTNFGQKA